jgi:hypothetical protein
MWTRKTTAEIAAADRSHRLKRLDPTRPIILALWAAGGAFGLCCTGCDVTTRWWGAPVSIFEAFRVFARAFTALFAVIYVVRFCVPESWRTDNMALCPKCQVYFTAWTKNARCTHCDVPMEPMRHWEYQGED